MIRRGKVGWHADGVERGHTSSGGTLAGYLADAIEGAPVTDAEDADEEAFVRFVYRGPMVDASLGPDGWRKYGHDEDAAHSLDEVGPERYARLLREAVPGVRFGRVRAGAVVWED